MKKCAAKKKKRSNVKCLHMTAMWPSGSEQTVETNGPICLVTSLQLEAIQKHSWYLWVSFRFFSPWSDTATDSYKWLHTCVFFFKNVLRRVLCSKGRSQWAVSRAASSQASVCEANLVADWAGPRCVGQHALAWMFQRPSQAHTGFAMWRVRFLFFLQTGQFYSATGKTVMHVEHNMQQ